MAGPDEAQLAGGRLDGGIGHGEVRVGIVAQVESRVQLLHDFRRRKHAQGARPASSPRGYRRHRGAGRGTCEGPARTGTGRSPGRPRPGRRTPACVSSRRKHPSASPPPSRVGRKSQSKLIPGMAVSRDGRRRFCTTASSSSWRRTTFWILSRSLVSRKTYRIPNSVPSGLRSGEELNSTGISRSSPSTRRQFARSVLLPSRNGSVTGNCHRRAGLGIHELHALRHAGLQEVLALLSQEDLRGGVGELHVALGVADEDGLHHAGGHGGHPPAVLAHAARAAVLHEGHLQDCVQALLLERLQHVAVRLGELGLVQGLGIGERGEVDDGNIESLADAVGRLDAAHASPQVDVHEHEVRLGLQELRHGLLAGHRDHRHLVAEPLQRLGNLHGHHALVLDHHDSRLCHDCPSSVPF